MIPLSIALPLASCQPGAIYSTPDGRAWYGHADRVNPATGVFQEATLTLSTAPRQGDEIWLDGNLITLPGTTPAPWPTAEELDRGIKECRAALATAPWYPARAEAWAKAETACAQAQRAVQDAQIALAEARAAIAKDRADARERINQRLAAAAAAREPLDERLPDHGNDEQLGQPDLSDLDWNDHPSLSPAERNR